MNKSQTQICRRASAGARKNDDIYIELDPGGTGICLQLQSRVKALYGRQIEGQITDRLAQLGVFSATLLAEDFGALPFVIDARVETAVMRAAERVSL